MALSSPGIGSNLDVNSIVKQLMDVEARPLALLARKEASFQAKLSAFGSLSGSLSSFQSAIAGLSDPAKFQALNAITSDGTILTASAGTKAVAGTYNVDVTSLAQAQNLRTGGQTSVTAAIGSGTSTTLTFQFGTIGGATTPSGGIYPAGTTFTQDPTKNTATVTIDSSNNTLQGIRDAINKANIGVTASIVSDGSSNPYNLVLTSKTGAASSMKISVGGDADLANLLAFNPADAAGQKLLEATAAANTVATVNGITVNSATKSISEAVQGVTLNVLKTGTANITVSRDSGSVTGAVNGLVKAFNELNTTLRNLTSYNAETKQAGPLLGDASARAIQSGVRQALSTPIEGTGSLRSLSDIGVSIQRDGTMALNATKLQSAITNNFEDLASVFAAIGKASDSLVSVTGSGSNTKAGTYAVNVSAMATQGKLNGTVNLNAAPTVIDANTMLSVSLNGSAASVSLTAGSYTGAELATLIQSAINGNSTFSSASATVSASIDASGFLSLTSGRYGSASAVSISTGTGTTASTFLGATPTATSGVDVAGTIGGQVATGSGQVLTAANSAAANGLKLSISDGATGDRGTIAFSRGLGDRLKGLIDNFVGANGLLSGRRDGINNSVREIERSREALNIRLLATEKRYRAQFVALDTLIGSMTKTSSFLQQQLANLPKNE